MEPLSWDTAKQIIETEGHDALLDILYEKRQARERIEAAMRADPLYQRIKTVIATTLDTPPLGRPMYETIATAVYEVIRNTDTHSRTAV